MKLLPILEVTILSYNPLFLLFRSLNAVCSSVSSICSSPISLLSISASSPCKAAAVSTRFGSGRVGLVNEFNGLRISKKRHHQRAASSGPAIKQSGVVCEAQDTTVDGYAIIFSP